EPVRQVGYRNGLKIVKGEVSLLRLLSHLLSALVDLVYRSTLAHCLKHEVPLAVGPSNLVGRLRLCLGSLLVLLGRSRLRLRGLSLLGLLCSLDLGILGLGLASCLRLLLCSCARLCHFLFLHCY